MAVECARVSIVTVETWDGGVCYAVSSVLTRNPVQAWNAVRHGID